MHAITVPSGASLVAGGLVMPLVHRSQRAIGVNAQAQLGARLGIALLDAGVADPKDWARAGDPADFVGRTLNRWARAHGAAWIARRFGLRLVWCGRLGYGDDEDGTRPLRSYLAIHPFTAGTLVVREVIAWAGGLDPRFAPVLYNSIVSLRELFSVWDYRSAQEFVDFSFAGEPDPEELQAWRIEAPTSLDSNLSLAAALDPKRLAAARRRRVEWLTVPRLRALSRRWNDRRALAIVDAMIGVRHALDAARGVALAGPEDQMNLDVVEEPLPILCVALGEHDTVSAAFDACMDQSAQVGFDHFPNIVLEVSEPTANLVQRALGDLSAVLRVLRAAVHLFDTLPGQEEFLNRRQPSIEAMLAGVPDADRAAYAAWMPERLVRVRVAA